MAVLTAHPVNALRVLSVDRLEYTMKCVRRRGDYHVVHVIWHQAVCNDVNAMQGRLFAQESEIG
jgi:hypothetical protein